MTSPRRAFSCLFVGLLTGVIGLSTPCAFAIRNDEPLNRVAKARAPAQVTAPAANTTSSQRSLVEAAQQSGYKVEWDERHAVPMSIRGADLSQAQTFSSGRGLAARGGGRYEEDAVAVMDNVAGLFRISNAAQEFRAQLAASDKLGFHHVRLQQEYNGLTVVGGDMIVHFDKADRAYQVNGTYVPDIAISTSPLLTDAQAIEIAQADLRALSKPVGVVSAGPDLVVYALTGSPNLRLH